MMVPNFILIGGQRCATGWIAQCLREHPEVFMAKDETRYFDRKFDLGYNWYRSEYFHNVGRAKMVGEKTANYLTEVEVADRIKKTLGNIKIVCCVRNPIDRLNSAILMNRRFDSSLEKLSVQQMIDTRPDLLERGKYAKYLRTYFEVFDRNNVLVLYYDDKVSNPKKFMGTIYSYLQIDDQFVPPSVAIQTKGGARENSNYLLANLTRVLLHRKSPFKKFYTRMRNSGSKWILSSNDLEYLNEIYAQEIEELELLLNVDLKRWKVSKA